MRIDEIKTTLNTLRAITAGSAARVGVEFELVINNQDGEYSLDQEIDLDSDEHVTSIDWESMADDVMNFYRGEYNSEREIKSVLDNAREEFDEFVSAEWDDNVTDYYEDWKEKNYPDDEDVDQNTFRDETYDDWYNEEKLLNKWLQDSERDMMSGWNSLEWPYYSEPEIPVDVDRVARSFRRATGIRASLQGSDNEYKIEPDSSIKPSHSGDAGLEFISPPLSITEMISQLNKVKAWALEGNAYTNKSCGLHINISIPGYNQSDLDYIKLSLFSGDNYILKTFDRIANDYTTPAMDLVKRRLKNGTVNVPMALDMIAVNLLNKASQYIHNGYVNKYTSINPKEDYVEFRAAGGDWLSMDLDKVVETMLRYVVALQIAMDPDAYKKEYAAKLYKVLTPNGDDNAISLFAKWKAGDINAESLKQAWAKSVLFAEPEKEFTPEKERLAANILAKENLWLIRDNLTGNIKRQFRAATKMDAEKTFNNWVEKYGDFTTPYYLQSIADYRRTKIT